MKLGSKFSLILGLLHRALNKPALWSTPELLFNEFRVQWIELITVKLGNADKCTERKVHAEQSASCISVEKNVPL